MVVPLPGLATLPAGRGGGGGGGGAGRGGAPRAPGLFLFSLPFRDMVILFLWISRSFILGAIVSFNLKILWVLWNGSSMTAYEYNGFPATVPTSFTNISGSSTFAGVAGDPGATGEGNNESPLELKMFRSRIIL